MAKRAVILHDVHAALGPPDQSDTLVEAQAIASVLRELDFEPETLATGLDLASLERTLDELAPAVVVNLVESLEGRGRLVHLVPALLESLGLPFTGCSASALTLSSDKPLAKRLLAAAGVRTPATFAPGARSGRWIVKSVWEHASLGLDDGAIVAAASAAQTIERRRAEHGGDWFAEEFVPGRELNVALLAERSGPRALPVAEIRFDTFPADKPRIVGYAAKWDENSPEYAGTKPVQMKGIAPALRASIERTAIGAFRALELRDYGRVDFRVAEDGTPYVIDVNPNCDISPDAGVARAGRAAGMDYPKLIGRICEIAWERYRNAHSKAHAA